MNVITIGTKVMVPAAAIPAQSVAYAPEKAIIPTGRVLSLGVPMGNTRGIRRLVPAVMKVRIVTVETIGPVIGNITEMKILGNEAPSITAASNSERGVWSKKFLKSRIEVTWPPPRKERELPLALSP
jgi:hypothetical protein